MTCKLAGTGDFAPCKRCMTMSSLGLVAQKQLLTGCAATAATVMPTPRRMIEKGTPSLQHLVQWLASVASVV